MPASMYQQREKVFGGFAQEVKTPVGDVFISYHPNDKRVQVSFNTHSGNVVIEHLPEVDEPSVNFWVTPKPPTVGSEVTQNGRTSEVGGVRFTGGRYYLLLGGVWEEWTGR